LGSPLKLVSEPVREVIPQVLSAYLLTIIEVFVPKFIY